MRGLLSIAAAMVICTATPAAANWGYDGNAYGNPYGGATYAPASYGYANAGYAGYANSGYGGYANLSQMGAALPSWGDCPCCNNVWAGYCQEKADRAARRHCNSCGHAGRCGHGCRAKSCNNCNTCDTCGSHGGCGCGNGGTVIESAPTDAPAAANPADAPPPAPEAPASEASALHMPTLPGLNWLMSLVSTR